GTAYTSICETALTGEDSVAIVGLGPVGLCFLILAKSLGARIVGVDVVPERLEQALSMGLDGAVDASREDSVSAVRAWSGGGGWAWWRWAGGRSGGGWAGGGVGGGGWGSGPAGGQRGGRGWCGIRGRWGSGWERSMGWWGR